jgi:DNA-binding transcriptional LysR family regulator
MPADADPEAVTLSMIRVFASTVRTGGAAMAADELQMTKAAVARQLQRLEFALSASLFKRSTIGRIPDGALLTIEGALLFEAAQTILLAVNEAAFRISEVRALRAQQADVLDVRRVANG